MPVLAPTGWRIEVTQNGGFWQWRKGSGSARQSRYGGRFDLLSEERKVAYEQHKARRQKREASKAGQGRQPRRSTPDPAKRLAYCQQAGLKVATGNVRGRLILALDQVALEGNRFVASTGNLPDPPVASTGTV